MVRVKIVSANIVKEMTESAAQRLVQINPKEYLILEPPVIEVTQLPPIQKKSAEGAGQTAKP